MLSSPLTVWQFDPANITPLYDMAICNALANAGCKTHLITSRFIYDRDLPASDTFETRYLYFRGLEHSRLTDYRHLRRTLRAISYPLGHLSLLRRIKRNPPDIVHIQWSRIPRLDLWLIRQIKALDIPVVHTVHDVVPLYAHRSDTDDLEKIYKFVDKLMVHTEANRAEFCVRYRSIASDCLTVIRHIEVWTRRGPEDVDRRQARAELGLPSDVPLVLFLGTIRPYKGLDNLVKAYLIAVQAKPDLHLLVVGRPDHPTDAAPLDLIAGHPNVHINITKWISNDLTRLYHLAADVAVFPYNNIYQSGALITAMEFGLPVIVTDLGGLPETVDGNGWIVAARDPDSLAEVLITAFSDIGQLRRMGQRSLEVIRERHSAPLIAQQLIDMYRTLVSEVKP